jgi:NADPH2:quinone reductase
MFNASADEQRVCAEDINEWVDAHLLKTPIGKTFPLAEAAQAHKFLEECTSQGGSSLVGKVIIEIG